MNMKFTLLILLLISSSVWAKWSVSTYNIRNFDQDPTSGKTDLVELKKIITTMKSEVMAFNEVVNAEAFDGLVKSTLPGYQYKLSTCGGRGKQKIAIAYDPAIFDFVTMKEDFTFSGSGLEGTCGTLRPVFLVTLKMKKTKEVYTFGGVHLKAKGDLASMQTRWGQYRKLENLVQEVGNGRLILLGDFNTTGYNIRDEDYTRFNNFLNQAGMWTASEELGCTSYWTGADEDPSMKASILDHIVMSNALSTKVEATRVGAHCQRTSCDEVLVSGLGLSFEKVSDHCPVQVNFK